MIGKLKQTINEWKWHRQCRRLDALLTNAPDCPSTLRLVLGVGRSGTSWLSQVLAKTPKPIRFFQEPLSHLRPEILFSEHYDHTAIRYQPSLPEKHPLIYAYRALTIRDHDLSTLGVRKHPLRDDQEWQYCLVKEVHSLLAAEALLDRLRCPTVFITRDPIYVVDSLLSFRGLHAPIWRNEYGYIADAAFLARYFPDSGNVIQRYCVNDNTLASREQLILSKILTVAVINRMLQILAKDLDFVCHIRYEELCRIPDELFPKAAGFLSLEMNAQTFDWLDSTQRAIEGENDPYSVFRDTTRQVTRPLRFLSNAEAEDMRNVLAECSLL